MQHPHDHIGTFYLTLAMYSAAEVPFHQSTIKNNDKFPKNNLK